MSERIHRYLDGEIPQDELTPEERTEAAAYEALIQHASRLGAEESVPDLTGSVMARLRRAQERSVAKDGAPAWSGAGPSWIGEAVRWFWEPRAIRLRPAWGLVGAALLAALFIARTPVPAPVPGEGTATANAPVEIFVQFRLDAPGASEVRLAGSFTDWEAEYRLNETTPGVWTILVPLNPGVHDYAFVVDGQEWRPDPSAPQVDDGFGGRNSRLAVISPALTSS